MVAENTCSEMGGIVGAHVYDFHIAVVFGCCDKIRLHFQGIGRRGKAVTDVYAAVKALEIGQTIDAEGFLYWYEGVNPHITSVTVAE